jgi:hypothetical protein
MKVLRLEGKISQLWAGFMPGTKDRRNRFRLHAFVAAFARKSVQGMKALP